MIYLVIYLIGVIICLFIIIFFWGSENHPLTLIAFSLLWPIMVIMIASTKFVLFVLKQSCNFFKWLRNDEYNFHQTQINKMLEEMYKNNNNFKFGR